MSALRSEEQAEANVYYHALLNIRAPALSHVAGIAQLNDASKEAALGRVAATVYYKYEEDAPAGGSARTFVHEVGHNQGLRHVYCPNAATEAAGTDPAYPHDGGKIGVYGFGIRSAQLYSPTGSHDYMTYCANSWVSDWTWNKTFARIETLTSWDYEGAAEGEAAAEVPLLWGLISPDGSEQWMSFRGPAPHPEQLSAKQRILASDGQGGQRESLAVVSPLSDDASEVIIAPLELDLDEIDALTRVDWRGEQHAIDLARVERRDRALSAAR
nr:zinc-dependent metalloprotease family protein [Pseudenhygromyxa sp. WMMC2535]